jgi:hypothetical protein
MSWGKSGPRCDIIFKNLKEENSSNLSSTAIYLTTRNYFQILHENYEYNRRKTNVNNIHQLEDHILSSQTKPNSSSQVEESYVISRSKLTDSRIRGGLNREESCDVCIIDTTWHPGEHNNEKLWPSR